MEKKGTFYFFTGLAGAGKTTIGRLFYQELKKRQDNILLFDGDIIRSAGAVWGCINLLRIRALT